MYDSRNESTSNLKPLQHSDANGIIVHPCKFNIIITFRKAPFPYQHVIGIILLFIIIIISLSIGKVAQKVLSLYKVITHYYCNLKSSRDNKGS